MVARVRIADRSGVIDDPHALRCGQTQQTVSDPVRVHFGGNPRAQRALCVDAAFAEVLPAKPRHRKPELAPKFVFFLQAGQMCALRGHLKTGTQGEIAIPAHHLFQTLNGLEPR
jgi:hypothetical protein